MAETKKDRLMEILKKLRAAGDIEGVAVISVDGLVVVSNISEDIDEETVAAMAAAMQGSAETAVSELKRGELNQIIVDSSKGKLITIAAGEKAILVILAKKEINLGLALLEIGKASGKISDVLGD